MESFWNTTWAKHNTSVGQGRLCAGACPLRVWSPHQQPQPHLRAGPKYRLSAPPRPAGSEAVRTRSQVTWMHIQVGEWLCWGPTQVHSRCKKLLSHWLEIKYFKWNSILKVQISPPPWCIGLGRPSLERSSHNQVRFVLSVWHHPIVFLLILSYHQGPYEDMYPLYFSTCHSAWHIGVNEWIQWNGMILIIKHFLLTYLLFDRLPVDLFTIRLFRRKQ